MPIYEYTCGDCGRLNEFIINIGRNSDLLKCSECGGSNLEKVMSAANHSMKYQAPQTSPMGSTCCGSNPDSKGCVPGSCCGAS